MTQEYEQRFLRARRAWIRHSFQNLNDRQLEAVLTTQGPLLLLAGAGSGKTTVLINRIANLMRFGCASDSEDVPDGITPQDVQLLEQALSAAPADHAQLDALCAMNPVAPWSLIAITFTNKAANELKQRLQAMLGERALDIWALTFHSACCRILRRNIDRLGYTSSFTIYDTTDSERVMKDVIRDMNLDDKTFPAKLVLAQISKAKDKMQFPPEFAATARASGDFRLEKIAQAYDEYQRRLRESNALDFDDIILLTVKLLQENDDVRDTYQRKFRYVMIDEYQDTNNLQYLLASLLAGRYENICVVGDDDQSIYKFRGATIKNILNFEKQYQGAKLIRLEQNYRSTKSILAVANAVISNNVGRKGKRLWTDNETGEPITIYEAINESDEARFVAGRIFEMSRENRFGDFAILYRTNAQSNAMEYAFKRNAVPYRIIGGTRFFDRAEIKDMLAYLWVINNRADDLRLRRIINNPPRGIGEKTVDMMQRLADSAQLPLYHIVSDPYSYPAMERAAEKLMRFTVLIEQCAQLLQDRSLPDFYDELVVRTGYAAMLEAKDDVENRTRLENVRELKSSIVNYVENADEPSLAGFLEEIALYTDIEQYDAQADAVVMMTMHSAKGLEFPHVFIVGAEEGLFPSMRSVGEAEEMEEERRLCYVALTRAKKTLAISYADQRMLYGRTSVNRPSRFLEEIPAELLSAPIRQRQKLYEPASDFDSGYGGGTRERTAFNGGYGGGYRQAPAPHTASPGQTSHKPAAYAQTLEKKQKPMLTLAPGDMVQHTAFGKGMVLSVAKMGNDAMLEIAFDDKGTKRLMAGTACAHMKKL